MILRALSWNLFHGRDAPPDRSLHTWRSLLLRATERNETHAQVNRDLFDEFARVLAGAEWDVALLQECPPPWAARLAAASGASAHVSLTARNSLAPLRRGLARLNPDLVASNEGGANATLVRAPLAIAAREEMVLRRGRPERRTMAITRLSGETGLCIANLHATTRRPALAAAEIRAGAAHAAEWAAGAPLLFGGDLNVRPDDEPRLFAELAEHHGLEGATPGSIDHLLSHGLEPLEPPRQWPPQAREAREGDRAIRLSDHAPVAATFRLR